MLGFQVRFVALLEWLTLLPCTDFFSQIWHLFAIYYTPFDGASLQSKSYFNILRGLWQGKSQPFHIFLRIYGREYKVFSKYGSAKVRNPDSCDNLTFRTEYLQFIMHPSN
jgi:hypothetical protein